MYSRSAPNGFKAGRAKCFPGDSRIGEPGTTSYVSTLRVRARQSVGRPEAKRLLPACGCLTASTPPDVPASACACPHLVRGLFGCSLVDSVQVPAQYCYSLSALACKVDLTPPHTCRHNSLLLLALAALCKLPALQHDLNNEQQAPLRVGSEGPPCFMGPPPCFQDGGPLEIDALPLTY